MKNLQNKLRKSITKISDKGLNTGLTVSVVLLLFTLFDIETLKKIEIGNISGIANTVDSIASPFLDIFENVFIKILIYALFGLVLILRIFKTAIRPRAIIINHSSFSNTQSSYDPSIVSGYSVREKDINLVDQMARHNTVDAIRQQDALIEDILSDYDNAAELFYYGIAHIPLIFRAGFQIGDEGIVRLLHKFRNEQAPFKEISSASDNHRVQLQGNTITGNNRSNEILVVVATSLPVADEDLVVFRQKNLFCELHFGMADKSMYDFDVVDSYAIMNRFRAGILAKIHEIVANKNIERIHLVLATSSDFTFFLAQGFSKNHDPEIVVYHYDRNSIAKYPWGISNTLTPANAVIRQTVASPTA